VIGGDVAGIASKDVAALSAGEGEQRPSELGDERLRRAKALDALLLLLPELIALVGIRLERKEKGRRADQGDGEKLGREGKRPPPTNDRDSWQGTLLQPGGYGILRGIAHGTGARDLRPQVARR
jgi:hypothetical protein